uniref:CBM21 domain-containing protein n=1 Tax=Angiostrongylus cantonensis TaxID=6313 RepID=A0A0K0D856_ANGCA
LFLLIKWWSSRFSPQFRESFTRESPCFLDRKKLCRHILYRFPNLEDIGSLVANVAFEKKVFVRYTSNNWQSYMDRAAAYQPSTSKVYDTFTFELDLPTVNDKSNRLEFCICYIANGAENWDSNGGENYKMERIDKNTAPKKSVPPLFGRYELHTTRSWVRFNSWNILE